MSIYRKLYRTVTAALQHYIGFWEQEKSNAIPEGITVRCLICIICLYNCREPWEATGIHLCEFCLRVQQLIWRDLESFSDQWQKDESYRK